ncbi:uncharacterized protein [Physcomitrium patens]|uniref:uncharacterized protein isoform X5 n=1 Tax=Physcomitrium patens TaxID=3218 RepID=UPI000D171B0B|nr:uncharacterized protein LOC112293106 isoform X5 [Physcomitrium patens]|eukprot:XP_024397981.1 uncharacterized protein LOC112293106 isoform X5 [Physcomitrella patens]
MDLVNPSKSRGGLNIFQYGVGELRIGELGDQDEEVDIDDDDTDTGSHAELSHKNDTSLAGVSVGESEAKSMAVGIPTVRDGLDVVSSSSSRERRELETARSSAVRRSIAIGASLPQPIVGVDSSPKSPNELSPKASEKRTSKRPNAREFRRQLSAKISTVRIQSSVAPLDSVGKSVDKTDERGKLSRDKDEQTNLKRKELESKSSTLPHAKRVKLHDDPSDLSAMPSKKNEAEEAHSSYVSSTLSKEVSQSKRKARLTNEREDKEKAMKSNSKGTEKRYRKVISEIEAEKEISEQNDPQGIESFKRDGKGEESPGVKLTEDSSSNKGTRANNLVEVRPAPSEENTLENQLPPPAGENEPVSFRSAFPMHAKKKANAQTSGCSKSHKRSGRAAHSTDENILNAWVACTKCRKRRKDNPDANLQKSTCFCDRSTQDSKHANSLAPQQHDQFQKVEEVSADDKNTLPEREVPTEKAESFNQTIQIAQRNMVWVKLQVDGKNCRWPGLIVSEVPPAIQKKLGESVDTVVKTVRLFHPRKDLDEYQVVRRSSMQPFHIIPNYKDGNSDPDFQAAVAEADAYFTQPSILKDEFSQHDIVDDDGSKLDVSDADVGCLGKDVPHNQIESNEPNLQVVEMSRDNPHCCQLNSDKMSLETLEYGGFIEVPTEQERNDHYPEAGNMYCISDPQCSHFDDEKGRAVLEDQEVIQLPSARIDSPDVVHGIVPRNNSGSPQFSQIEGDEERIKLHDVEVIEAPINQEIDGAFSEAVNESGSSSKRDDPQCSPPQADAENPTLEIKEVELGKGEGRNLLKQTDKKNESSSNTETEVGRTGILLTDARTPDDVEMSERAKTSEASGLEEAYGYLVLELEISSTRRLSAYDDSTQVLYFQDGSAVNIDAESLGKAFNKKSVGLTLHECIHEVGRMAIRRRFPKGARSSNGLKYDALDRNDDFAKRLRDTWVREYQDEPMPTYLKTRFVAGCVLEERGEPVNWASELTRTIRSELKEINMKTRKSLSPSVLRTIFHLLENQVDQAPVAAASVPIFKAAKEEKQAYLTAYDGCCQKCKCGGELFCCDNRDCRKTYHLKCLKPSLEEVPSTSFICPSCSEEVSGPCDNSIITRSVVEDDILLHVDDVSRQRPLGVGESTTSDKICASSGVNSRMNLEENMPVKGQTGKKHTSDEEVAMVPAVYTKDQQSIDNEIKRQQLRSDEEQGVVSGSSSPVILQESIPSQPSNLASHSTLPIISTQVDQALPSDRDQRHETNDSSLLLSTEVLEPTHRLLERDNASDQNAGSEVNRDSRGNISQSVAPNIPVNSGMGIIAPMEKSGAAEGSRQKVAIRDYHERLMKHLSTICSILELPGSVSERVDALFKHVLQSQKNLRKPRPPHEFIAIELAVVWLAADQLNYAIDKSRSITKVEEEFCVSYENRPQLEGPVYNKVRDICASFKQQPAPAVFTSVTSEPGLELEIIPARTAVNHPFETETPPPSDVFVQSTEGAEPTTTVPDRPLSVAQEEAQCVETDVPLSDVLSSASPLVPVTPPADNSPAVEESQVAHQGSDSHAAHVVGEFRVDEANEEVVLVEADPRFVSEELSDALIDHNRLTVSEPVGTGLLSAPMVEQGLSWVHVDPPSNATVTDEQDAMLDDVTPAGVSSSTIEVFEAVGSGCLGNSQSHTDSLQNGHADVISKTLGAHAVGVTASPLSQSHVQLPSSLSTQPQVVSTEHVHRTRLNAQATADTRARLRKQSSADVVFVTRAQTVEMGLIMSRLKGLEKRIDDERRRLSGGTIANTAQLIAANNELHKVDRRSWTRGEQELKSLEARQRADRDKLKDLYKQLEDLTVNGVCSDEIELEIKRLRDFYSQFPSSPVQLRSSLDRPPAERSVPYILSGTPVTEGLSTRLVQVDGRSDAGELLISGNPADNQRRHVALFSSSATTIPTSIPQNRGRLMQAVTGEAASSSPRPAPATISTAAVHPSSVQLRGHPQRSNTPVHFGPTPNLQRRATLVSRSLTTPATVPIVPLGIGTMARPSTPASAAPMTGNATGQVYQDVLTKEKEKLNKELEKTKNAYELESQRIKAEYDKEAELLHKKYETLLVEQHRAFTKRQQQVQQNIIKVEWNRQLAETLKLREELSARAAVFAGLSLQTFVQPIANQQSPSQVSGRQPSGGAVVPPVRVNISRGTTNTGNSGILSGISSMPMQFPGTSSTRMSSVPLHQTPRHGLPPTAQNEQPQSTIAEAMTVLAAASANIGNNVAVVSRDHQENISLPSPNINTNADELPPPPTSGSPLQVVAPTVSPAFQDPILSIIRNSAAPVNLVAAENSSSALGNFTTPVTSTTRTESYTPMNPSVIGLQHQVPSSQAAPDLPQAHRGAATEDSFGPVSNQTTGHIHHGTQERVAASVAVTETPHSLIYLSDSDDE